MRHKLGILLMIAGTALVLGALGLFLQNRQEEEVALKSASEAMAEIRHEIAAAEQTSPAEDPELQTPVELLKPEDLIMTEKEIKGHMYIGYLSIPDLKLDLPVMSEWSYYKLRTSPCRYSGTTRGKDLVILAHNYQSHFGQISKLQEGSEVYFTDMDGKVWRYEVVVLDILADEDVEEMNAGEYDLTLFTCTKDRVHRHTIRCKIVN